MAGMRFSQLIDAFVVTLERSSATVIRQQTQDTYRPANSDNYRKPHNRLYRVSLDDYARRGRTGCTAGKRTTHSDLPAHAESKYDPP